MHQKEKMSDRKLISALILLLILTFVFIPKILVFAQNSKYKAEILLNEKSKELKITGQFINNSSKILEVSYILSVQKKSESGISNSKQSGTQKIDANTKQILSSVGLNIDNSLKYTVLLKVFNKQNELIAADSVNYGNY